MQILKSLSERPEFISGCAVTLGNFDGVHLGHRELFRHLVKKAHALDSPSVIFTFDPHPLKLLAPGVVERDVLI